MVNSSMMTFPTQPFLGFHLSALSTEQFLRTLEEVARARTAPFVITYLNAATLNLAYERPDQARRLQQMDCLYADGQAVVWGARWLKHPIPERVNAGDFTIAMTQMLARAGLKLALVGGRPPLAGQMGEAEQAAQIFRRWAPSLKVVYTHHGYFKDEEAESVRQGLEAADPDLVLIGMGSPRQEAFALEGSRAGRARVWWCVGALFEYYAGTRLRAPVWMRRAGLEWIFRLTLEPGRLWRRYLLGNPLFVWRVLRGRPPRGLDPE